MDALLNTKTSGLCFNKDDFMVKDFSVDDFVSNYRKYVSLETMLEDLGLYHKILCSAMVELINKDYADFVNLSSNLVGLDKSIANLSLPLEKLKTEVEDMKDSLEGTLNSAKGKFSEYSNAHKNKVLAHHIVCVLECLKRIEREDLSSAAEKVMPSDSLERIALDFNLVQFHMNKISGLKQICDKKEVVEKVANNLRQHLEYLFLESVSSEKHDTQCLSKVLRIFALINKETEIETYFRQTIVKPYMQRHITEEKISKHGLSVVYERVLDFIPTFCTAILEVTRGTKRHHEVVPGYDFLVNAVWPEIVRCFELIAPVHVYAPGDPQLFHMNYTSSILFLDRFEHSCEVQTSVQRLRQHESYKKFLNKWNLDVYFQIRFQEIAGNFESSLFEVSVNSSDVPGKDCTYLLNACSSLMQCIKLCWDEKIYLQPLSYNFFRLTLQLISRFNKWACTSLNCNENQKALTPILAAMVIRDVKQLITEVKLFFMERICHKISRSVVVEAAFQESIQLMDNILPHASSLIVKSLTKKCCSHLKLISDIPRLYRKTNREIPSKPSGYMLLVFKSVEDFLSETDSILSSEYKQFCLKEVTDGIVIQCVSLINDVLTSIKKMEDSLKILKRARDKPLGQTSSGAVTDDDKIRRQLAIDIKYLEETVQKLGLEADSVKSFKELKYLVNSAAKNMS